MTERPKDAECSDLFGKGEWTHQAVPPGCECPDCKEWRMDLLVWIDDEEVRCDSCGTIYNPGTGEVHSRGQVRTKGGSDDGHASAS